jgi:hypothetical protein
MKKFISCLALTIGLNAPARSQNSRGERLWTPSVDNAMREFLLQSFDEPAEAGQAAQRRDAKFREHQFLEKIHQFITRWDRFAKEYNSEGVFNIKSAREMSRAFHELERSEGWPKPETTR